MAKLLGFVTLGGAMLSTKIPGVAEHADDAGVLASLEYACTRAPDSGGLTRIGLEGPDGAIYRLVIANGDEQAQLILEALILQRFRMVEPRGGMDIVLSREG